MKETKLWGHTTTVVAHPWMTAHRIYIEPGGYCSRHHHEAKYNAFVVVSGLLLIEIYDEDGELDKAEVLGAGDTCSVAPGVQHRFVNLWHTPCEALEWYWPDGLYLSGNDIVRADEGGIGPENIGWKKGLPDAHHDS